MDSAVGAMDRLDDVARVAVEELLALPGVYRVGLALSEGGGRRLRFTASDRDNSGSVDWCHIDAYEDVPLTTVVRTGAPVIGAIGDLGRRYADFVAHQRRQGTAAMAAVPLPGSASPMGGFVLYFEVAPAFDTRQRAELDRAAEELAARLRASQAVTPRDAPALAAQPVAHGARVADLAVDDDARAAGSVRAWARRTLSSWQVAENDIDSAVLCFSELVTNVLIHTRSRCEVRLVLDAGLLTGTVRDFGGDRSHGGGGSSADPLRVHGRGLQLVDAVSTRWSSEPDAAGTTVWFALETSA